MDAPVKMLRPQQSRGLSRPDLGIHAAIALAHLGIAALWLGGAEERHSHVPPTASPRGVEVDRARYEPDFLARHQPADSRAVSSAVPLADGSSSLERDRRSEAPAERLLAHGLDRSPVDIDRGSEDLVSAIDGLTAAVERLSVAQQGVEALPNSLPLDVEAVQLALQSADANGRVIEGDHLLRPYAAVVEEFGRPSRVDYDQGGGFILVYELAPNELRILVQHGLVIQVTRRPLRL